ncbi:MAG: heavy metal translocating P-type ATPase [Alkalibacterium gilvum]|uniref:Cd2+/Zn2+-exporting ATPase n=4 Tax=Carnobacteriaceae TaxID=186828 RepID=A0A1H6VDC1_9LACT|nr:MULTISPECIES: heavy metal translocating P-type ATPase [Carnobacteriaceae]MDN6204114.1 heavy metal translocating P-type ATPase [Tetragenococcus halophilus]MDN6701519.1 heavy metal translocating P-type ATPase [Tetragenococcus koreensis]MDN6749740.1 heavy metal translocating P-type ATPase [Staphylococcus equorum]MDN6733207.1 heavy metal translocating P-type ATPase [Tetragenococcus koreensis]TLQ05026.1 heavy metal translocating P-type ATPase [Marinilactibacillus psychrotolerans]
METVQKQQSQEKHNHNHNHGHDHGKMPVVLYFVGLALAIIALFLDGENSLLQNSLFSIASISAGYHVILLEGIGETIENTKSKKRFTPNSHILMGLAALGASLIGNFWEGTLLILIFSGAHFLEDYAEGRSKREITKLLEMNPTTARLIMSDGNTKIVDVNELKVGDQLQVLNGDQVPIDGVILTGNTSIDESSINGESIPKEKSKGDGVFGSTINGTGSFTMEVTKENKDTVFSKILQLVNQNQNNQTKAASIIQKFEPKYVTVVLIAIPLFILLTPLMLDWTWSQSIYRGLVLLVAASPCALAAATVSVTLSATSNLAKRGVLSKGSSYLSQLADIQAIAFDKTGTLTKGKPEVTNYYFADSVNEEKMIDIVVALEKESNHPLADAILRKFEQKNKLDMEVENQIGKGLTGDYKGKNYRIGKPTSFSNVADKYIRLNDEWASEGKTVVYVSEEEKVVGLIALMDIPSENAKETIEYFKKQGIHTTLITGDSEMTGKAVAKQLGIDEVIANVMPEDKSRIIDEQKEKYGVTAMVGDGVNDAPALVNADVGIAMGDGTDVAVEVSDLVLMKNDLLKLVQSHNISSKMNRVIWQNIIFSMAVVAFLVIASLLGLTDIAISVIIHEGSTLVVILNGLRLLRST